MKQEKNFTDSAGGTQPAKSRQISENIILCRDGSYRWIYEFPMLRNPVILLTVLKVLLLPLLILFCFLLSLHLLDGEAPVPSPGEAKVFLLLTVFFLLLGLLAYFVLAALKRFRYCVLFEMNELGISHTELPRSFRAAQRVAVLTVAAGLATGHLGTVGTGLLAAAKQSSSSEFSKLRSIRVLRHFNTIKLNMALERNQVYTAPEDFDFVLGFIEKHLPQRCRKS